MDHISCVRVSDMVHRMGIQRSRMIRTESSTRLYTRDGFAVAKRPRFGLPSHCFLRCSTVFAFVYLLAFDLALPVFSADFCGSLLAKVSASSFPVMSLCPVHQDLCLFLKRFGRKSGQIFWISRSDLGSKSGQNDPPMLRPRI